MRGLSNFIYCLQDNTVFVLHWTGTRFVPTKSCNFCPIDINICFCHLLSCVTNEALKTVKLLRLLTVTKRLPLSTVFWSQYATANPFDSLKLSANSKFKGLNTRNSNVLAFIYLFIATYFCCYNVLIRIFLKEQWYNCVDVSKYNALIRKKKIVSMML